MTGPWRDATAAAGSDAEAGRFEALHSIVRALNVKDDHPTTVETQQQFEGLTRESHRRHPRCGHGRFARVTTPQHDADGAGSGEQARSLGQSTPDDRLLRGRQITRLPLWLRTSHILMVDHVLKEIGQSLYARQAEGRGESSRPTSLDARCDDGEVTPVIIGCCG